MACRRPDFPAALQAAEPDWDGLVDGARRHRVVPLLLRGLESGDAPARVLTRLRALALSNARRCLAWLAEADRLLGVLERAGIRALVLKGCALSLQLHGDPALRQCGDIDLLVEPGRLWDADAALARHGYRRDAGPLDEQGRDLHRTWIKDLSYSSDSWHVELHHRLTDNPMLLPCDFEQLWAGRETVALGELALPVPSRRFAALYLCVHGADHGWERLGWLADIAALLRDAEAQSDALDDAERLGLAPVVTQALHLAHHWLGLALHDSRLRVDRRAERRLRRFIAGYSPGSGGGLRARWDRREWRYGMVLQRHLIRYRLRSSAGYRLRQVMTDLASPGDWRAFPLPRRLAWLYPVLRPVGWMLRHGLRPSKDCR